LMLFSLIFSILACKKKDLNEAPSLNLYLPVENFTIQSVDTFQVKAVASDDNANNLRLTVYLADFNLQSVSVTNVYNFSGNFANLDILYILNERWLESGVYYLVVTASDGELLTRKFVKLYLSSIPKKIIGYVVGINSGQYCDIYIGDTNFVFTKKSTINACLDGIYDSYNNYVYVLSKDGKLIAYNYPELNVVYTISSLNKIGSPFKGDLEWKYPYVYVTNANGSIMAIDRNGNPRYSYRTLFSPYKLIYWQNKWICLTDLYPQNFSWIEVPQCSKNYQNNFKMNDILSLDEERCLAIQQHDNVVKFYTYKPEINYLNSFGHSQNGTYNGSLFINGQVLLSINDHIYEMNPIYGTLTSIYQGNCLSLLKYEASHQIIYGVHNNMFFALKTNPIQSLYSYSFNDKVVFYDFIYE
ncbi:MAG: hypothetical protein ACUVQP_05970, partial [Bacteroidales bacterium]